MKNLRNVQSAVRRDFRFEFEVGRRSPARKVGHEGPRLVAVRDFNGTRTLRRENRSHFLGDGNGGNVFGLSHGHGSTFPIEKFLLQNKKGFQEASRMPLPLLPRKVHGENRYGVQKSEWN